MIKRLLIILTLCLMSAPMAFAETFPENKAELEAFIKNYLLQNPHILTQALQELEEHSSSASLEAALYDADDPVFAPHNDADEITLVEFFDYNCGYCRQVHATVREVIKETAGVRLIYKEFPILGEGSDYGARAALAAAKQGRYDEFHTALMESPGFVGEVRVNIVAESLGLDKERLLRDMESSEIREKLWANHELARGLGIRGTPAFVLGNRIIPGAVSAEVLKRELRALRDGG